MSGERRALIVTCAHYDEPDLQALPSVTADAEALSWVLADPSIGGYDVERVTDQPAHVMAQAIESFFSDRKPDDLLLLHLSCHGVKDEGGELFFAGATTNVKLLASTALPAAFVNKQMARSRSRRIVLLLDCCYAGAFEKGLIAKSAGDLDLRERLASTGKGRAVITASSALEYSFVGGKLEGASEIPPSVFTGALVEGLRSGEADRDLDGLVELDELYEYVYDAVRDTTANQTPSKWELGIEGDLVVARRAGRVNRAAPLENELEVALASPLAGVRMGAADELVRIMRGAHPGRSVAARQRLEALREDDSLMVRSRARDALARQPTAPEPQPSMPEPPPPVPPEPRQPEPQPPEPEPPPPVPPEPRPPEPQPGEPQTPAPGPTSAAPPGGPRHRPPDPWWRRQRTGVAVVSLLALVLAVVALVRPGADRTADETAASEPAEEQTQPGADAGQTDSGGDTAPADPLSDRVALVERTGIEAIDVDTGERSADLVLEDFVLPTIAPDRRSIVALRRPGSGAEGWEPYVVDPSGGQQKLLSDGEPCSRIDRPSWNEGGDRIAFRCADGEAPGLYVAVPQLDERRVLSGVTDVSPVATDPLTVQGLAPRGSATWHRDALLVLAGTPDAAEPEQLWRIPVDDPQAAAALQLGLASPFFNPDVAGDTLMLQVGERSAGTVYTVELDADGQPLDGAEQIEQIGQVAGAAWPPGDEPRELLYVEAGPREERGLGLFSLDGEPPVTPVPDIEDEGGYGGAIAWGSR